MTRRAIFFYLTICLLLFGCASISGIKRQDRFAEESYGYEYALFFGKYETAYDYTRKYTSHSSSVDFQRLKDFKLTSYEVLTTDVSEDGKRVHQRVEIKYYMIDNLVEKELIDNQLWIYNDQDKRWYLESGLPNLK